MEELIRKMIRDLLEQIDEKVPEVGPFKIVYSDFKKPDKGMCVTDWMLKIDLCVR